MDPAVIGARLASSAVKPLVRKLFVAEGPGAGLVDKPVRISRLVAFRGEKRTLTETDVHRLAAKLVVRTCEAAGPHDRPPDGEREAVTDAVTRTLHALGDLDLDDVQAVQLGHTALADRLRRAAGNPDQHLSADAEALCASVLVTACLHMLHFFTQRSTFVARTLVDQSRRQAEMIAKIDELIARTPRPDGADAAFEARYLAHITQKHGRLTIYGIDLSDSPDRWPLDSAYLSLEATPATEPKGSTAFPRDDGSYELVSAMSAPLPAEQALAGRERVLLRGVAGSGKTTLVQWLAVSAAKQSPDDRPAHLRDRIPFVLPLRTLIRNSAGLPTPDRFLAAVNCPIAGAQPSGWTDRVLSAGRGLLLVDGIDEIPERDREPTRRWLRDVLGAFPGNAWLVTSRPSAVRGDWLTSDGFTELTLSPMRRDDVAAFIQRWHAAARPDSADTDRLGGYEQSLLDAVRTKQDLSRLATNPLMCGLICALHRDRRGYLPHGRKELYDAALSMLLSRRDRERDMCGPDGIELGDEPQIQLLQRLAYWLIRNGRTELDRGHAERIIAEALPSVPSAASQGDADQVFRHLLLRSGLLREPTAGAVDFVHRTFQDYLGAKAAVEAWDIGLLIKNAADAQWEDVLRMAVAHARPRERAELLDQLVTHGDGTEDRTARNRVHLLAMACLEHATELDPRVRGAVEERAAALIPPRSTEEARALAAAGPVVLEVLPGPEGLLDDEAVNVVNTASFIGTDAAIPVLKRFRRHPSIGVRSQLAWTWQRFDTDRYAHDVLRHLPSEGLDFVATSPEELRTLRALDRSSRLQAVGPFSSRQLLDGLDSERLTHLRIEGNPELRDLDLLRGFSALESLALRQCPEVSDLSLPAGLPLRSLTVEGTGASSALTGLSELSGLESLLLCDPLPEQGLAALPASAPLTFLFLEHPLDDQIIGVSGRRELRDLGVNMTEGFGPAHWAELARLPALETLGFGLTPAAAPLRLPENFAMPHLRGLYLTNIGIPDDVLNHTLSTIVSAFPGLRTLSLGSLMDPLPRPDLSPLAALPELRHLSLHRVLPATGTGGLAHVDIGVHPRPRG
ncbi:NACHT domain-containing protein [Streptomyces sp. NPDC004647]|uniref:NACHT domain-containing protein n=1 Tax=Streptomyces sp. NPDC004647 TaxID=3154671 RepID=UPI0033B87E6B